MPDLDLIVKYGGWPLFLGACTVIRFLFLEMRRRDLEHATQTQALNDRVVASIEKQIPLLQSQNEQSRRLVEAISRMDER